MTSFFDALPQYVDIDGVQYALNTDYRVALRIITAFEDASLADFEKQSIMVKLLYKQPPPDMAKAVQLAVKFLNCGDNAEADETQPLYTFTRDAPYIYSAVSGVCGAQTLEGYMHWYRFEAYFCDISEQSFFARLIYLRNGMRKGTLTKDERRCAAQLSQYMTVPGTDMQAQGEADEFMRLLKSDKKEEQT